MRLTKTACAGLVLFGFVILVGCTYERDPLMDCWSDLETVHEVYAQARADLAVCGCGWESYELIVTVNDGDDEASE